jgi:hypothetical protein
MFDLMPCYSEIVEGNEAERRRGNEGKKRDDSQSLFIYKSQNCIIHYFVDSTL